LTGTVIYWLGTNSATNQNWSGDNWTNASGGTVVTGLKPGVGDTLVFDTTQMHFNDTPSSFAPINDMNATVTGLTIQVVDGSSTDDFDFHGNTIFTSGISVSTANNLPASSVVATFEQQMTLSSDATFTSNTGTLTLGNKLNLTTFSLNVTGAGETSIDFAITGARIALAELRSRGPERCTARATTHILGRQKSWGEPCAWMETTKAS